MGDKTKQEPIKSKFGHFTKPIEIIKGINLNGKIAVITGGYTGVGLETTKALTSAGATVVVLARDIKRAKKNLRKISNVEIESSSIDTFANKFLKSNRPIHFLINHAGIIAPVVAAHSDSPYGVRPWAIDMEQATSLWELSEKMCDIKFII